MMYEKEYTLTLKFNRLSWLEAIASLYQLSTVWQAHESVDSSDIEDLDESLSMLLDYILDTAEWLVEDSEGWKDVAYKARLLSATVDGLIVAERKRRDG